MPTPSPQVPPPLPLPLPPRALPGRAAPCARRPPAGARAEGARARFPGAGLATAAIGNGLAFVVLVYATAGISGGHLNPAISTAFVVTGRCQTLAPPPPDALPPQTVAYRCCAPGARRAPRAAVADTGPSTRARARRSLGKQRYACYCVAQVLGAIFGALALKLALPPAMDETPFTTTGSLTFSHPFQVAPPRASSALDQQGENAVHVAALYGNTAAVATILDQNGAGRGASAGAEAETLLVDAKSKSGQ